MMNCIFLTLLLSWAGLPLLAGPVSCRLMQGGLLPLAGGAGAAVQQAANAAGTLTSAAAGMASSILPFPRTSSYKLMIGGSPHAMAGSVPTGWLVTFDRPGKGDISISNSAHPDQFASLTINMGPVWEREVSEDFKLMYFMSVRSNLTRTNTKTILPITVKVAVQLSNVSSATATNLLPQISFFTGIFERAAAEEVLCETEFYLQVAFTYLDATSSEVDAFSVKLLPGQGMTYDTSNHSGYVKLGTSGYKLRLKGISKSRPMAVAYYIPALIPLEDLASASFATDRGGVLGLLAELLPA